VGWTAVLLVVGSLLAIDAVAGFLRAGDACFFQNGPCPQLGDEHFQELNAAVFVIPLIWLAGVVVGAAARALANQRRPASLPPTPGRPGGMPPGSGGS
jgi:hypothetical protein